MMTTGEFLTSAWSWNPWVIGSCVALLVVGGAAQRFRLNRKTGWLFAAAAGLFLTLASPIDALADGYLFSAHMLQHLLLLLILPPLILWGLLPPPVPASFQNGRWKGLNWILRHPAATWILGVGGMWIWHEPSLCNAAVSNAWVHRIQYVSLLGMGLAFWWPIIGPWHRQRLRPLVGILYLFSACLGCTLLGILITFSPVEVCYIYLHPQDRLGIMPLIEGHWGLTPKADQQLGGLLMWVPACLIYLGAILGLLARWYGPSSGELTETTSSRKIP